MQLEILTPEKKVFAGDVDKVFVPGAKGAFEVLKNHAPIISTLTRGTVRVCATNRPDRNFLIPGGVIEVRNNVLVVLVESAEIYCSRYQVQCSNFGGHCSRYNVRCGMMDN